MFRVEQRLNQPGLGMCLEFLLLRRRGFRLYLSWKIWKELWLIVCPFVQLFAALVGAADLRLGAGLEQAPWKSKFEIKMR
jgi:hypothetical protein